MNYLSELKRRNIFKVAVAYLALAWVTLQIADVIIPALGLPEMIITAMVVIGAIGFPFALFFAWAFELTPEGMKRTEDVELDESIRATTGQKINYIIIGLLSLAVFFLLFDRSTDSSDDEIIAEVPAADVQLENTIAVMPFADMSPDGSQEYFGDGIAEEILNVLVSVEDLKVTSRTSSFAYKGKDTQIPAIAAELNVNYILEGSIRTAGDNVRVTAQLIDVAADQHLWSDTFDRDLSDIFAIQDEISLAISNALQVELLGDQVGDIPTENMEAYDLYLQARQLAYLPSSENSSIALPLIRRAVELDPEFAKGWSELSAAIEMFANWNITDNDEYTNLMDQSVEAAEKAIFLDPSLAAAWTRIAVVEAVRKNWSEAYRAFLQINAIDAKDYVSHFEAGMFYTKLGWFDEAEQALERADAMEPNSAINISVLARAYFSNGKIALSRETLQRSLDLGYGPAQINLIILEMIEGDYESIKKLVGSLNIGSENSPMNVYYKEQFGMGIIDYFGLMHEAYFNPELRDEYLNYVPEFEPNTLLMGSMLLQNGERLVQSARANTASNNMPITYAYAPPFRVMLNQPAMKEYLIEVGLVDFWQANKFPSFCRPVGEDDFECQDGEGNWP